MKSPPRRVLIAEPDEMLREDYARFFTMAGFEVETVAAGLDCLAKLRAAAHDVLVIDLELPWGGGDGVLARLRDEAAGRRVPLVFVTGDEFPGTLSERSGIRPDRCFQKPFRLRNLLDEIRTAADGPSQAALK